VIEHTSRKLLPEGLSTPKNYYYDIPPEVIDYILDYLYDDKKTLARCALTSSKLLAPSRYHLLGNVELVPENRERFIQFLDSPHSTLPSCVRHLDIEEGTYTPEKWIAQSIAQLATSLVSVRTLIIDGLVWEQLDDETKTLLHNGFKSVTFLKLDFPIFDYIAPLAKFASSFPVLETLALDRLMLSAIDEEDVYISPNYRLPSCVRSVLLRLPEEHLVNWLLSQPRLQLDSLSVVFRERSLITCVASLLRTAGELLLHLEISMPLAGPSFMINGSLLLYSYGNSRCSLLVQIPLMFISTFTTTPAFVPSN
jgi:hypothetical protein